MLRADGGPTIGLGHVMRLLALAEIVGRQFSETVFVVQNPADSLRGLLATAGLPVQELPEQPLATEAVWLRQHLLREDDVLVLDGYGFDFAYQQAVRRGAAKLVCLDDLHAFPFAADLVLNPAGGISEASYEMRTLGGRLLAGPAFAPLRSAFHTGNELLANPGTVLLCLGGADPYHLTQQVATQLLALPEAAVQQLHVVIGPAYKEWQQLHEWGTSHPRLTLHRALPAAGLGALMRGCGAAVLSPSTISYEYCAAGGGLLFTLPTADNQHDLDQFLRGAGLALPYPSVANVLTGTEAVRVGARLRAAQRQHFDGLAPTRLRQAFAALRVSAPSFHLLPIALSNSELLLAWTNDPVVRQHSFSPKPVARAEHEAWLRARLADPNSLLLLAEDIDSGAPVGLIRFQVAGTLATLSYQLAAAWRGRGLAAPLLLAGTEAVQQRFPRVRRVQGQVRAANLASGRAFERAGFERAALEADAPAEGLNFVWIA